LLKHKYKPFIYILIKCVAVAFVVNLVSDEEIVTIKNQHELRHENCWIGDLCFACRQAKLCLSE